jgi:UDP-glucose 4-epimerase
MLRPAREDRHTLKVLVTGGSGFIGSHVVDKLLDDGHEVRSLDLADAQNALPAACEKRVGDLLDSPTLLAAAADCETIIHLAAAADVGLVAQNPSAAEALNSRGTLNVLEAARATGAAVVYASTIWVYSDVAESEVDEDTQLALPSHLYTATKLAGEMYCRSYEQLYDVPTTILRFGIPYGPRARPAAVLPIFVNKALAGEPLTIAGDGMQTRRFVYVEDLAQGVVCALRPEARGRIYNLVGEEDTSVRDIAEAVRAAVGDVSITHIEGRAGDFAGARVCGERAASELGWRARTSFHEGVGRYVAWQRQAQRDPVSSSAAAPCAAPARLAVAAHTRAGAPAVPARRRLAGALTPRVQRGGTAIGAVLALILYLLALDTAGLSEERQHTVLVIAALGLASTISTVTMRARFAVWTLASAAAALLIVSPTSGVLDFAHLTPALLALGLAGTGLLGVVSGRSSAALKPALVERGKG